jgi:hypothetical protein
LKQGLIILFSFQNLLALETNQGYKILNASLKDSKNYDPHFSKRIRALLEKMNTNLDARTNTHSYDHTYANRFYFYKHHWKLNW